MSIIIGIDHGYYAIKTAHCSFPAGLTSYGEHEPYTRQGLLEFGGCFFVCGSGRQPIQRDKTVNDNYYLLTLAAIAKEIRQRGLPPECSVRIAAGLPLTSFGRDKPKFKDYLLRSNQPVNFCFEGVEGEALLLLLDAKGICASSGSACTSGSLEPSHVLLAVGVPYEAAHGSLRLSLSAENTPEEVEYLLKAVPEVVTRLRSMSPVWRDLEEGRKPHVI